MKTVFYIFALLIAFVLAVPVQGAHAQQLLRPEGKSALTNEDANAYFDKCIKDGLPVGGEDDLMSFCACTSAFLKESMTQQDMEILYEKSERGKKAWHKMVVAVYGPCIEYPVTAQVHEQCISDKGYYGLISDMYGFCACTTDAVRKFSTLYAPDLLDKLLTQNPYKQDPLYAYTDSPEFKYELQKAKAACTAGAVHEQEFEKENRVDIVLPQHD